MYTCGIKKDEHTLVGMLHHKTLIQISYRWGIHGSDVFSSGVARSSFWMMAKFLENTYM
jgi:hypothetical protein